MRTSLAILLVLLLLSIRGPFHTAWPLLIRMEEDEIVVDSPVLGMCRSAACNGLSWQLCTSRKQAALTLPSVPALMLPPRPLPAVNNKHKAVVRYIGTTSFAEGIWYGLELEREIGKSLQDMLWGHFVPALRQCCWAGRAGTELTGWQGIGLGRSREGLPQLWQSILRTSPKSELRKGGWEWEECCTAGTLHGGKGTLLCVLEQSQLLPLLMCLWPLLPICLPPFNAAVPRPCVPLCSSPCPPSSPPCAGKHEGTVLGVTYFTAPKKRGTFVRKENLTLYDTETEAAGKMQSAVRMSLAKRKAKQEVLAQTANTLDADDEAQNLVRRQKLMNSALGQRLTRDRPENAVLDKWEAEAAGMSVESSYSGPVLTFPLTLNQIVTMMESFKAGKRLHYKYAFQLVSAYRRFAAEAPTLVETTVAPNTRLTICGDTHGQLQDLLSIFTINGIPSPTNRYLMNGDFVDRGDYSCEILFTLMAFSLLYSNAAEGQGLAGSGRVAAGAAGGAGASASPSLGADFGSIACLLNRGNHESNNQNVTGGFMMEVLDKYSAGGFGPGAASATAGGAAGDAGGAGGEDPDVPNPERGLRLYDLFQSSFDCMPLAHTITGAAAGERKVFVVHGGLMQRAGVTLAQVAAIKRKREIPYGLPGFEDKLFEDLMWR